jgi:hypothetical protein
LDEFVPRDFDVPRRLETPQFVLEPLGPEHNDQDYDAWTSAVSAPPRTTNGRLVLPRVSVIAVTACCIAVLGGATASPAPATQTDTGNITGTSIDLYAPFDGGGVASAIRIEKTARGYCWTTSIADARADAFRCFVGNYIYDPCFANGTGSSPFVLCPLYKPVSKVLRVALTKPLTSNAGRGNPTRYPPWAIETTSARWCTAITGASGMIAGMRISYGCSGGGILIGSPRRTSPRWTIFYAPSYKARDYKQVALASAWW